MAYVVFPNQWATLVSSLGGLSAILLWQLRGKAFLLRWFVVMFGVEEGAQIFVCHLSFNWWPTYGPNGLCSAYTGLPLALWGLSAVAVLAYWIAKENHG